MMTGSQGMEGVAAAQTAITSVDGAIGELRYRGYPIGELAEHCTFEEVAYLLWHGDLPTPSELESLRESLRSHRGDAIWLHELLADIPASAHPLDVLRYAVSADALRNPLVWDNSAGANLRKCLELTAWFPEVVAAWHRRCSGGEPIAPPSDMDTAEAFLFMLTGVSPSEIMVRTLDTSLILHADHEFNASTFAARVTIATQSNLHAAIASALGTLSGPRHGGASERIIRMLEEIGTPDRAESYVREELAARRRIMGFGHRVYRTSDPRSRYLRVMAERMIAGTAREWWMPTLANLSVAMERERSLYPNVDLYAAVVNYELGIRPAFYTSVFAISRIVGWSAHSLEQLDGRMIRPAAEYIGPGPRSMGARASA